MAADVGHVGSSWPGGTSEDPAGKVPDSCTSGLCGVLVLAYHRTGADFSRPEPTRIWHALRLSALEEPESPDRPPIL